MALVYLDAAGITADLAVRARQLRGRRADVLEVWLFGSLATGRAAPGSDADLLIVLERHPVKRWFDRAPEFMPAFDGVEVDIDLFPLTREESARSRLAREARARGRRLA